MLYCPLFEIPTKNALLLALLRHRIIEMNCTYPEYVELVENLGQAGLILILNRLQLTGEKPFTWAIVLSVKGQEAAFKLWCCLAPHYQNLPPLERMTRMALTACDGFITDDGRVWLQRFEGRDMELSFTTSPAILDKLVQQRLIAYQPDQVCWVWQPPS